jgi:hypothetical protein
MQKLRQRKEENIPPAKWENKNLKLKLLSRDRYRAGYQKLKPNPARITLKIILSRIAIFNSIFSPK